MGHKTHPIGFRVGVVKTWNSKWFEHARYRSWLHEDLILRSFLKGEKVPASVNDADTRELARTLRGASIAEITIERAADELKVNIFWGGLTTYFTMCPMASLSSIAIVLCLRRPQQSESMQVMVS